ncbi:MAG TPA: hypothetical protein VJT49_07380 [Amycolatopsis sp.]|uniref:hypothetical protein n=1 Tax=Amycolatopsis sp. TaxID=37632 RepID=UPI002B4927A4|nr:hypothetical protein [Amycolatopsis sp.]HKS44928.1 hypothetical protein [Amycolatopsis sp.]
MPAYVELQPLLWPIIALIWLIVSMYSRTAVRRRWHAHPHPASRHAGRVPPDARSRLAAHELLRARWEKARERYGRVAAAYGEYESDALQVLRLPALADPEVPSTARFIDAFHEAMALHTDLFPPEDMARKFVAATDSAALAWDAAREAAEKLRASRFTAEERALIAQGIKLLELAEGGTTPAEQEAAFGAARQVLARLERSVGGRLEWRVPRPAHEHIEHRGKPLLP